MAEAALQEVTKNQRVTFRLKASSVKEVILMGDFNNWNNKKHQMKNYEGGIHTLWKPSPFLLR